MSLLRQPTTDGLKSGKKLLQTADLVDLGFKGPTFTWTNSRHVSDFIFEHLDRTIISTSWQGLYPVVFVNHLPMIHSDLASILLRTNSMIQRNKIFRVEH
jgi:hypothetical protein